MGLARTTVCGCANVSNHRLKERAMVESEHDDDEQHIQQDDDDFSEEAGKGASEENVDEEADESAASDVSRQGRRRKRARSGHMARLNARKRSKSNTAGSGGTSSSVASVAEESSENSEAPWDAESNGAVDATGVDIVNPNLCIFCGDDEEHDPSDEFEEYLACAACGDNAHAQCARDVKSLSDDSDKAEWRCPACVDNDVVCQEARSSPPVHKIVRQIARDLLPPHKGHVNPNSHSVFNTLILDDDPMDGSRPLRKRKSSGESDKVLPEMRKRPKRLSIRGIAQAEDTADALLQASARQDGTLSGQEEHKTTLPSLLPSRRSRTRQRPQVQSSRARIMESGTDTLVMTFSLQQGALAGLDVDRKKRKRRERDRARREKKIVLDEAAPVPHYPALQPPQFTAPLYSFQERESDDYKAKPYGGILSEVEADTSRTFPQPQDRKAFEEARQRAEDAWRQKTEIAHPVDMPRPAQRVSGPPSKIKCISFGQYEIDTWHAAPYPEEYSRNRVLYICEFCLKYLNSDFVAWRHKLKCPAKHPPGDEIYRDGSFSFFEVDGRRNSVYCQNLCLLAKLFLGSKTLYYDVEPFLFYVMTENDDFGCHFVGYFSKEKRPSSLNNVSCILVLPIHQRRGFGHLLIDFSYLLTRVEEKTGSPEKPLSDMGLVSYRSYWRLVLCTMLLDRKKPLSIAYISDQTGMTADDVVSALEGLRAIVRDPITKTYALRLDYEFFREYVENHEKKGYERLNPEALIWVPYVMGRHNTHYEDGPQLQTIAPREGEVPLQSAPEEGVQQAMVAAATETAVEYSIANSIEHSIADAPYVNDNVDQTIAVAAMTPFPALALCEDGDTPKRIDRRPAEQRFPYGLNDIHTQIPAARFEVFPPLQGTAVRRRPGRPWARGNSKRGTPARRAIGSREAPTEVETSSTARRTRSNLGGMAQEAEHDNEDEDTEHINTANTNYESQNSNRDYQRPLQGAEDDLDMLDVTI